MRDSIEKQKMFEFIAPMEIRNVINWNLQSYIIITYYLLLTDLAMRNIFTIFKNFLKLLDNSHENNQRSKKVNNII